MILNLNRLSLRHSQALLLAPFFLQLGCGSSSSSSTSSAASGAFPKDLAISSPTASSTTSFLAQLSDTSGEGQMQREAASGFNTSLSYKNKVAKINAILAGTKTADCQVTLPTLTSSTAPTCYGPNVNYQNFPSGPTTAGQLPSGDLGLWSSAEASGEACASAKLNQLISDVAQKEDTALLLDASMVCLMNVNGTAIPAAGASAVDLTSVVNSAIQTNNSGVTVTSATFQRLSDSGSNKVYQIALTATTSVSGSSVTMTFNMKHMPTASDNSTYQGKIWGSLTGMPTNGDSRQANQFFTVGYERKSTTSILAEVQFAGTATTVTKTTAFKTNGDLDWSVISGANSANLQHALLNIDPSTGLGNASFSWQAGGSDDKTRVFNVYTGSTSGTVSGCGFFGFGDPFTTTKVADNTIKTFICAWAPPAPATSDHTGKVGYAQKQCMTQNSTSGLFTSTTAKEKITYAPVASCSVASGGTFTYGTSATKDSTWVDTATTAVTNNLVLLSSDTDFATYSAPTAPTTP